MNFVPPLDYHVCLILYLKESLSSFCALVIVTYLFISDPVTTEQSYIQTKWARSGQVDDEGPSKRGRESLANMYRAPVNADPSLVAIDILRRNKTLDLGPSF